MNKQRVGLNIPVSHFTSMLTWDKATIDELVQKAIDVAVKVGLRVDEEGGKVYLEEAESKFELKPRIEFGVVALAQDLGFPRRAAGGLYILARVAGWVAHVIEQRLSSALLRPRAKFIE